MREARSHSLLRRHRDYHNGLMWLATPYRRIALAINEGVTSRRLTRDDNARLRFTMASPQAYSLGDRAASRYTILFVVHDIGDDRTTTCSNPDVTRNARIVSGVKNCISNG